jgi:hypothetical protein
MSVQVKTELPQNSSPILAEVVRGGMVESRHHAAVAVVDAHGGIVRAWGDVELPVPFAAEGLGPALEPFGLGQGPPLDPARQHHRALAELVHVLVLHDILQWTVMEANYTPTRACG